MEKTLKEKMSHEAMHPMTTGREGRQNCKTEEEPQTTLGRSSPKTSFAKPLARTGRPYHKRGPTVSENGDFHPSL
ncbi:hypothetical protein V6N13_125141 [Hibiscus sabdariffa]